LCCENEISIKLSAINCEGKMLNQDFSHHTRKKHSVKERLPQDIPIVERHHAVDPEGRTCLHYDAELVEIGTEVRETLGMAPDKVF
jgi:hypothetical protein